MNELVRHRPVEENQAWATTAAKGSMLPKQFQNNPGNLFIAAEYADSLGIPRVSVLSDIYVVEGKPTLSATLMAAQVRRAGHKLRVEKKDGAVRATLIRHDDPDFTYESVWNMEKAQRAGLANRNVWKAYPEAMMRSRAVSEVIREGAAEVLSGITYTPEDFDQRTDDLQPGVPADDAPTVITTEDLIGEEVSES